MSKYLVAFAMTAATVVASTAMAETVKRGMFACVSEDALDEAMSYAAKSDTNGSTQLLLSGQCTILKVGEQVSVASPGFMRVTIRYRGVKLITLSEAVR